MVAGHAPRSVARQEGRSTDRASSAAAQEPDGYLYTPREVDPENPAPGAGPERWSWLHTSHELYDQGHMIEAAVAHYSATGKRNFLDIAIKSADLMVRDVRPERAARRARARGSGARAREAVSRHRRAEVSRSREVLPRRARPRSTASSIRSSSRATASSCTTISRTGRIKRPCAEQTTRGRPRRARDISLLGDDRHLDDAWRRNSRPDVDATFRRRDRKKDVRDRRPWRGRPHRGVRRASTRCRTTPMPKPARRSAACSGITGCSFGTATPPRTTRSSGRSTTAISQASRWPATLLLPEPAGLRRPPASEARTSTLPAVRRISRG